MLCAFVLPFESGPHWVLEWLKSVVGDGQPEYLGLARQELIVLGLIVCQCIMWLAIWWGLRIERLQQLRRKDHMHWPVEQVQDCLVRLGIPHGAIFLNMGIMGTFIGLALSIPSFQEVTARAMSGPGVNTEQLSGFLEPVLVSFCVAVFSSIIGIVLSILAKAIYLPCEISQTTTRRLKGELRTYSECLSEAAKKSSPKRSKREGFYVETVEILVREIVRRNDFVRQDLKEKVEAFCNVALIKINENAGTLTKKNGFEFTAGDLRETVRNIRELLDLPTTPTP